MVPLRTTVWWIASWMKGTLLSSSTSTRNLVPRSSFWYLDTGTHCPCCFGHLCQGAESVCWDLPARWDLFYVSSGTGRRLLHPRRRTQDGNTRGL
jgi:hypothetical protein